ncbi:MAG: peptidase [Cryomorphaceae bacterium]|nr:MAG: peptidase [Cryomorphaceae bacterium]
MKASLDFLRKIGMPAGDAWQLPDSSKRFADGAQYRFEVPGIQGPKPMKALLEEIDRLGMVIHRVTQTKGIMLLSDDDIREMVSLAADHKVELILAVGPRATYDTSASVNTPEGQRMGYRLRGQDQIVRAMEDIRRAVNLGCRGFLVYDEGCLWVLNEMRRHGEIPAECHFKVSAHTGHGNPCSAFLLQNTGANSINPVRDIQLPMLASMRQAIDVPIDVHTENPASTGGFIRHYEVPEMIRVAAPIYLKTGGSVAKTHSWDTTEADARQRAKQVSLVKRMIDQYYPEAKASEKGSIG